jgi:membrane-associated protease RseP (regulator of RpoE activity)
MEAGENNPAPFPGSESDPIAVEIEAVRSLVAKHFPIYDVKVGYQSLTLFITPDQASMEDRFEQMRIEMNEKGYIPLLNLKGGEYTVTVVKRQKRRGFGIWVNVILLVITSITTIVAGALFYGAYVNSDNLWTVDNFLWGALTFALPLMLILGIHELSHYVVAKRYNVAASLPFFIPSIPPLGTLGALISLRDPIPDRKALIDIGIAGPIGGLIVTIPITIIGLYLTGQAEPGTGVVGESGSVAIMIQPLLMLFTMFMPIPENVSIYPTLFAAWVGFLVTAINLLPAGQLDGGHIARGFLGDKAKYLSYATVAVLFYLGIFYYQGWLLFALIVLFLGIKHPQPLNDISKLDTKHKFLGGLAIALLLVTFVAEPMVQVAPDYNFSLNVDGPTYVEVVAPDNVTYSILVANTGNTNFNVTMQVVNVPGMWGRALYLANGTAIGATDTLSLYLPFEGVAEVILMMTIPSGTQPINTTVTLNSYSINSDHKVMEEKDPLRFTVNVTEGLASVDAISSVQGAVDPLNMGLEELQASWRLNLPGKGYSHLIARP